MLMRFQKLKYVLIIVSVLWSIGVSWIAIATLPASALYTKESPEVQARMEEECTGSYQARYECKNMIAIEVGNHSLTQITYRLILILSVPMIAVYIHGFLKKRQPKPVYAKRPRLGQEDLSWKTAAKTHVAHPDEPDDQI
jgi:hypothetical protein